MDYYIRTYPTFPVAARDFLLTQNNIWGDKKSLILSYSITHEDYPKFPKVVRAQLLGKNFFLIFFLFFPSDGNLRRI
jgi:hypothetical protein